MKGLVLLCLFIDSIDLKTSCVAHDTESTRHYSHPSFRQSDIGDRTRTRNGLAFYMYDPLDALAQSDDCILSRSMIPDSLTNEAIIIDRYLSSRLPHDWRYGGLVREVLGEPQSTDWDFPMMLESLNFSVSITSRGVTMKKSFHKEGIRSVELKSGKFDKLLRTGKQYVIHINNTKDANADEIIKKCAVISREFMALEKLDMSMMKKTARLVHASSGILRTTIIEELFRQVKRIGTSRYFYMSVISSICTSVVSVLVDSGVIQPDPEFDEYNYYLTKSGSLD